jgi:hypothetical protein
VALLVGARVTAADVASQPIEEEVYYRLPLPPCELPSVVKWLARAAQRPAGIEQLPDDCRSVRKPAASTVTRDQVYLTGKRVGEALNELVAVDPRYAWVETDGVIVMRPVSAWANQRHFLHRAIQRFSFTDQHIGVALGEWLQAVSNNTRPFFESHPLRAAQRTEEGNRPFTVAVAPGASAISALDQIVRAHGKLIWEVSYCQPAAERQFATVFLWTTERNPTGIGAPLAGRPRRGNGTSVDPCIPGIR